MSLALGIDTGGTFTDAVVFDDARNAVLGKAKSPTTYDDLANGIAAAMDGALASAGVSHAAIGLVSLSTTLATNALVQGGGRPVCAVMIGFDTGVLTRMGLADALGHDPLVAVSGGHDPYGRELEPFDAESLLANVRAIDESFDGFAVTAHFSVRNPAHEIAARTLLRAHGGGRPVTCSHELSAKLNGPKRAVTAILNARLVPIVDELVRSAEDLLRRRAMRAPLMVVRGDGSLVSAAFVRERPVETILSGPAASVVGGAFLSGLRDAVIADIGGTTTDVAVLEHGVPRLAPDGAVVGGHRTMVASVDIYTVGLGGDSEVVLDDSHQRSAVRVGPRRIVPVSTLVPGHVLHRLLDAQLAATRPSDHDGSFVVAVRGRSTGEHALDGLLAGDEPLAVTAAHAGGVRKRQIDRAVRANAIRRVGFTPTDAATVLGSGRADVDVLAASKTAALLARRPDRLGRTFASSGGDICALVVRTVVRSSARAVLAAALRHDDGAGDVDAALDMPLVQRTLDGAGSDALVRAPITLTVPIVALGAAASTYYPAVASLLGTSAVIPENADVANAVGAVVGRVSITREAVISAPSIGMFLSHVGGEPVAFDSLDSARAHASAALSSVLAIEMVHAGAAAYQCGETWEERRVVVDGASMLLEAVLRITAHGRARVID